MATKKAVEDVVVLFKNGREITFSNNTRASRTEFVDALKKCCLKRKWLSVKNGFMNCSEIINVAWEED